MSNVQCPRCEGRKKVVAFGIVYKPGHDGPPVNLVLCPCCDGVGELTQERMARMQLGERFREYREKLGLGLRAAANEWGMKPSELSYIEQGRTVTDWKPPGFSD